MSEPTAEGLGGPLSIAAAVESLDKRQAEPEAPVTEAPEPDAPEPEADAPAEPEVPDAGDEAEVTDEPPVTDAPAEPDEPAVAAPYGFQADDREWFASLPKDVQARLAPYERNREAALHQAQRSFAEARSQAQAEAQQAQAVLARVEQVASQAEQWVGRKDTGIQGADGKPLGWNEIDWDAWDRADPQAAGLAWARYQREQTQAERTRAAAETTRQLADQAAYDQFFSQQAQELQARAPELAQNGDLRARIGDYLVSRGHNRADLKFITAAQLQIAHDAMRWTEAQARAPKPGQAAPVRTSSQPAKSPAPVVGKTVRPSAAATPASPKRAAQEADNRFRQTRSIEDAVRALTARGAG